MSISRGLLGEPKVRGMVVEEILPVPGRGPPRQGGLPVNFSQKLEGLNLELTAVFALGDAASCLGILQVQAKGRQAGDPPTPRD